LSASGFFDLRVEFEDLQNIYLRASVALVTDWGLTERKINNRLSLGETMGRNSTMMTDAEQDRKAAELRGLRRTIALASATVRRRVQRAGLRSLFSRTPSTTGKIIYVDAGLHKRARELQLMRSWFSRVPGLQLIGFEPHPDYFQSARKAVGDWRNVELLNFALIGPGQGANVQLHLNGGSGVGDSLIRHVGEHSISVPALRLSAHLRMIGFDPKRDILLLRMNIEGAEVFVLDDMSEANLITAVDGYYGEWNDPYKIGGEYGQRFDALMHRLNIEDLPFNDRDSRSALRRAFVRYDIVTSILAGMRAKATGLPTNS
jgi:FkbM family methyltransferase